MQAAALQPTSVECLSSDRQVTIDWHNSKATRQTLNTLWNWWCIGPNSHLSKNKNTSVVLGQKVCDWRRDKLVNLGPKVVCSFKNANDNNITDNDQDYINNLKYINN